jgi:flavin-dependent dehydrogenase
MSNSIWPVVVVGAGPAGLVAAITLARAGIRTLVLNSRKTVLSLGAERAGFDIRAAGAPGEL